MLSDASFEGVNRRRRQDIFRKAIPVTNGSRKKGVTVCITPGLDLYVVMLESVASARSALWVSQGRHRDANHSVGGLVQVDETTAPAAGFQRAPSQVGNHRRWATTSSVVTSGKPGGSALDLFQLIYLTLGIWVPDGARVLQSWPYQGLVGEALGRLPAHAQVATDHSQAGGGFLNNAVDMAVPPKIVGYNDAKVLIFLDRLKVNVIHSVAVLHYGSLSGNVQDMALFGIEFHHPFGFPLCESLEIPLECMAITH